MKISDKFLEICRAFGAGAHPLTIISANLWEGRLSKKALQFLWSQAEATDIFCLQEIFHNHTNSVAPYDPETSDFNFFAKIQARLPQHVGYFSPMQDGKGLAIFYWKGLHVIRRGECFVHKYRDAAFDGAMSTVGRQVQWIDLHHLGKPMRIANFHGLWGQGNKGDTPERLAQSSQLVKALGDGPVRVVLVGDFNLDPDTKSLQMIETKFRNLNREFNLGPTRTDYYPRREKMPFADYAFASKQVLVDLCEVLSKEQGNLPEDVSDHCPLRLVVW